MSAERGFAGAEALLFGTLVLVTGTLVATAAWGVLTSRAALDDAAREYLRAYTEADSPVAAIAAGREAARTSLAGDGVDADVVMLVEPDPSTFGPCAEAGVELHLDRPAIRLPFVEDFGAVRVEVRHAELVDPHREMAPGPRHDPEDTPCDG
jgi:hypothetical protein